MTQPCKICHGTGHVECPAQTCAHWCSCTVCNGTGKVEVYEDWSQGFAEEKVRAEEAEYIVQVMGLERWVSLGFFPRIESAVEYEKDLKDKHPENHYRLVARCEEEKAE